MSARNLFVINPTNIKVCDELKEVLIKISEVRNIGVHFNIKGYKYMPYASSVHFYVSNQYCIELSDYYNVIVKDNDLTKAFAESFRPTKNENYFGLKTIKYVITNHKI